MTDTERGQIERLDARVQQLDDKVDELREDRARAEEIRRQQGEALVELRRALEAHAQRTEAQFRETGEHTTNGFRTLAAKIDEGRPKPWTPGEWTAAFAGGTAVVSAVFGGLAWLVSAIRGIDIPPPPPTFPTVTPAPAPAPADDPEAP